MSIFRRASFSHKNPATDTPSPRLSFPLFAPPVPFATMIRVPRPPSVQSLSTDSVDPLSAVLRPPPSESEEDRKSRLQREAEAKQISDRIDDEISQDEKLFKKRKEDVKVSSRRHTRDHPLPILLFPYVAISESSESNQTLSRCAPENQTLRHNHFSLTRSR